MKYLEEKLREQSERLTVVESALAETPEKERVEQFANEIVALKDSQQEIENKIHELQTRQNHSPIPHLGTAFYRVIQSVNEKCVGNNLMAPTRWHY